MFPWTRLALRRRVVINLVNGSAMQGVLFKKVGPLLVLREAVYLEPNRTPLEIDGEALVDVGQVLYTQLVP